MGRITLFVTETCPHCVRAKEALKEREIPFEEISLVQNPERRRDMLSLSDQLTVPQVFFNDHHVGGASDLLALLSEWDEMTKGSLWRYKAYVEIKPDPTDPRLALEENKNDGLFQIGTQDLPSDECAFGCIILPDGKAQSIRELTTNLIEFMPRHKLPYYAKYYVDCFPGSEGVDALIKQYWPDKYLTSKSTRKEATAFGLALQKLGILHHVCNDHPFSDTKDLYYRLQPFHQPNVLNSFKKSYRCFASPPLEHGIKNMESLDPMAVVNRLQNLMHSIERDATSSQGVDYVAAGKDPKYQAFEEMSCELQCIDMSRMDDDTKMAFGINLYNIMIQHAYIKVGVPETGAARGAFFGGVCYDIGGHPFSFDDLEHGVLRANTRHPYHFKPMFGKGDPRLAYRVSELDPRIHFVLNCGANSCPPVSKYTAEAISQEMRIAAMSFCQQDENVFINEEKGELTLSMILKWYRADFCSSAKELPQKLLEYLRGEKKEKLTRLISSKKTIKIKYAKYDWGSPSCNHIPFKDAALSRTQVSLKAAFRRQASSRINTRDIQPNPSQERIAKDRVVDSLNVSSKRLITNQAIE